MKLFKFYICGSVMGCGIGDIFGNPDEVQDTVTETEIGRVFRSSPSQN